MMLLLFQFINTSSECAWTLRWDQSYRIYSVYSRIISLLFIFRTSMRIPSLRPCKTRISTFSQRFSSVLRSKLWQGRVHKFLNGIEIEIFGVLMRLSEISLKGLVFFFLCVVIGKVCVFHDRWIPKSLPISPREVNKKCDQCCGENIIYDVCLDLASLYCPSRQHCRQTYHSTDRTT